MLIVIAGAGASFDAISPGRQASQALSTPPLASSLFEETALSLEVLREIPQAAPIVQEMRRLRHTGGAVETSLASLVDRALSTRDAGYIRDVLAIRFYLRELIVRAQAPVTHGTAGLTNYLALVGRLYEHTLSAKDGVCYVTFNYDTLLETAVATRYSRPLTKLTDYIHPSVSVLKPHGSVNWVQAFPHINGEALTSYHLHIQNLQNATSVDMDHPGEIIMLRDREKSSGMAQEHSTFPALAVPVDNKDDFVFPPSHMTRLVDCLRGATELLLIGWRASEAKFLELCAKELPTSRLPVHIVDHSSVNAGAEAATNMGRVMNGDFSVYSEGFSGFVETRALDDFISSLTRKS